MPSRHLTCFLMLAAGLVAGGAQAITPTLAGPPNCNAARCVPDNFGPGRIAAGFGGGSDFRPGQTFEPRFGGVLSEVHLGLYSHLTGMALAIVEIRTVADGMPTTTVLASALVPGAPYAGNVLYTASFAGQNVVLLEGTRYAITLSGSAPPDGMSVLGAFPPCGTTTGTQEYVHSNDTGVTWSPYNDRSFVYEVCLDATTSVQSSTWGRLKTLYE